MIVKQRDVGHMVTVRHSGKGKGSSREDIREMALLGSAALYDEMNGKGCYQTCELSERISWI